MTIRPISLRQAIDFVQSHHRHSKPPQGGLWAIALMDVDELVGVAIAGRPVSRVLQRRGYMEIIRICMLPDVKNGCSMLYGRCRRIGQLMGYERFVTYTLPTESGGSLRAAGFVATSAVKAEQWTRPGRPRVQRDAIERVRWEAA